MAYTASLVAPIFAIIVMGRASVWLRMLDSAGLAALNGFAYWIALPALLFGSVAEMATSAWLPIASVYLAASLLHFAVALLGARLILGASLARIAVFALDATYGNVIYLGASVVSAIFGPAGVSLILAIIAFHSGILLPIAAVLIELGSQRQGGVRVVMTNIVTGILRNPIIMSIALGFIWRATGLSVPIPIGAFLSLVGRAAAPLALFCLGASLPPLTRGSPVMLEAVLATILKLVFLPLSVGALAWMAGISGLPWTVAVVTAAMPTGANAFLLVRRSSAFAEASAGTVVIATAVSVVTISGLLAWIRQVSL